MIDRIKLRLLIAFFKLAQGPKKPFKFKDWGKYNRVGDGTGKHREAP